MTRSERIVLVLYCLLIVLCCIWVPWHIVPPSDPSVRAGHGWLWSGPSGTDSPLLASPDFPIIGLELLALTVLAGAAFVALRRV
jgi:hypothetical protein